MVEKYRALYPVAEVEVEPVDETSVRDALNVLKQAMQSDHDFANT